MYKILDNFTQRMIHCVIKAFVTHPCSGNRGMKMADVSIWKSSSIVIFLTITVGRATHFRGGTLSWKYLGQIGEDDQVEISFRLGWRRDYYSPECDDDTIQNMSLGYSSGGWTYHNLNSYNSTNQTTEIICTAYESAQNWAYGYNRFVVTVNRNGPFYIRYTGTSWISGTVFNADDWGLTVGNIDFDVRSDTGAVNNPPRSFSAPIVRLIQGCPEDIIITRQDDDDDIVTCRYAVSGASPNECGSACNGPSSLGYAHFHLNETTCSISYDGGGATILVAVALVLEDYPRSDILLGGSRSVSTSEYLSQIPIQFIVEVGESSSCNVMPTYPSQTIQEDENITIPLDGGLNRTLYAYSSTNSSRITQFVVIGPLGMQTLPVTFVGDNLYSSQLSWIPQLGQSGIQDVCYYAIDSNGSAGKQVCLIVTVTELSSPCEINNGGCSDICTFTGLDRICSCSLPCWKLDRDDATCLPEMTISCNGQGMKISVQDCATTRTVAAGNTRQHIEQEECQSTKVGETHQLDWRANSCGIEYQVSSVQVQYSGNLRVWRSTIDSSSTIERGQYRLVPVTCVLSSTTDVSASFVPEVPINNESFPVEVNIEGFGQFYFYFEFYKSSLYSDVVTPSEYPMSVTVNDRVYFSVGAIGEAGFIFFTQECVAIASSGTNESPLTYTFLKNGCFLDSTLMRIPTTNSMEDRLSIQAFDFGNKLTTSRENADISLQCTVMICDAANTTSRCYQGCVQSERRKRSASGRRNRDVSRDRDEDNEEDDEGAEHTRPSNPESPLQSLKGRFILVGDSPGADVKRSDTSQYLYWALIAIGGCLLITMIFLAQRVTRSRNISKEEEILERGYGHSNKASETPGGGPDESIDANRN